MKRIFSLMLALLVLAVPAMAEEETYAIGICQLVQHEALDNATHGFMDAMTQQLDGRVRFTLQNASGDTAACISIVNSFIAEEVDLILANSTPALQAAYAGTGDIPILGVSVTDYAAALDMDNWTGITGVNVSGASDLAPMADMAELIRTLYPEAGNVGLLYCSAEANSEYQAAIMTGYLTAMGYACESYTFTDSNDVFSVAQSACAGSDVIFTPTDNTAASCAQVIRNVVEAEGTPIIGGDSAMCETFGVATLAVDYYDLGRVAGEMACDILAGADISAMPVRFAGSVTRLYNPELCSLLGLDVGEGFEPIA